MQKVPVPMRRQRDARWPSTRVVLAKPVYCHGTLTCATAIERTLFNCSAHTTGTPLVHFKKVLCNVCGVAKLSKQQRVDQGCKGNTPGKWTKRLPLCVSCEAKGLVPARAGKQDHNSCSFGGARWPAESRQHNGWLCGQQQSELH